MSTPDVAPGTPLAIDWFDLVPKLDLRGPARQLAENAELGDCGERALTLRLAPGKENLNTNQIRTRLEKAIAQALDRAVRLNIEPGDGKDTPATRRLAREDQKMKAARTSLEGDPNVQALQETFGAVVEPDSIRPVD